MKKKTAILTDSFKRKHSYLRISLTERCNLRCTYCMPAEGIPLVPRSHIMTYDEIYKIAKTFTDNGVTKIRLTGGEPLIRKDIPVILEKLASLPVEIGITTNGVTIDRYIETLKKYNIKNINVSLDTLDEVKFKEITRRNQFEKVYQNILLLVENGFNVKINAVLIKGFNENEIIDFIELTKDLSVSFRFIEFMPFDGNKWDLKKMVSYAEIMKKVSHHYSEEKVERLQDAANDTSKNYRIKGFKGSFAIISSVTNPFCDSCNRLRLTADGKLKNCLFSATESDILTPLRDGKPIEPIIQKAVLGKFKIRGGMDTLEKLQEPDLHSKNRSMISIGG
ncbi:MAG: GTP 3',8-cyclase MoaA [Flavobacteriaceae bacterium]|nr:GTP 3',8-cyclase MoaA [Flavobacteriaceae bacterium]